MTPVAAALLLLNILCDTAGQLAFKQAADRASEADVPWQALWRRFAFEPWIWAGIGLFVLEFFLWLAVLSVMALSQGVLLGSASILVILIGGRVLFGERLAPIRILGASLITLGVGLVGIL